jgi:hypothetical protein
MNQRNRFRRVVGVVAATVAVGLATAVVAAPAGAAGETLTVALTQIDGTAPFDADNAAGHDSSGSNGIVRTNDVVTYTASLANNGGSSQSPTITFTLPSGQELVQPLPNFCLAGSSVSPATVPAPALPVTTMSWTTLPAQTITCVVADRATATSFDYSFTAKVRSEVPDGTTMPPVTATASSTGGLNTPTSNPVQVTVSAAPRFDLQKNGATSGDGDTGVLVQDIKLCTDPDHAAFTACQTMMFPILISTVGVGGKGATVLTSPITFQDDISPDVFWGAGTTANPNWDAAFAPKVRSCGQVADLATLSSFHPFGKIGGPGSATNAVRDSGTFSCPQTGGTIDVTITGTDTTAYTIPSTNGTGNVTMPSDRSFVVSGWVEIEFPLEAIQALGTQAAPGSSEYHLDFFNEYTGFAPTDIGGATNIAEPTGNNDRSGNSQVLLDSGFDKVFAGDPGNPANVGGNGYGSGTWAGPPGSTALGNGTGNALPGQTVISAMGHDVKSPPGFEDVTHMACDSWDNTKSYLRAGFYGGLQAGTVVDPSTGVVSPAATFGTAGYYQSVASDGQAIWVSYSSITPAPVLTIQYSNGGGTGASANDCLDETAGWFSTPAAVPGNDPTLAAQGVYTGVSRVRYAFTIASTITEDLSATVAISIGLQVANLPDGTIVPNFAAEKESFSPTGLTLDQMAGDADPYIRRETNFDPDSNNGILGDRLIMASAVARLNKQVWNPSATPPAFVDNAIPVYASSTDVDYRLIPSVSAGISTGATSNVFVEDCLAPHQSFVTSSFEGIPGTRLPDVINDGAPVGAVITCPAGRTYVRWELGDVVINSSIPAIVYTAHVGATAPNGTLVNDATITATGDSSTVQARSDTAGIQIVTPTGIKLEKAAVRPVVEVNPTGLTDPREIQWTVSFANIDTTGVSNVDIIDRLPAPGQDGTNYTGSLAFVDAAVTVGTGISILYTAAPPASLSTDPEAPSNGASGSTVWCDAPTGGTAVISSGACPTGPATVTGLRIRRAGTFASGDPMSMLVTMLPTGNAGGDVYVNVAQARADGVLLGVGPLPAEVTIIESSIGDRVWYDLDADGIQDAGEAGVPGFPVTLQGVDLDGNTITRTTTTDGNGDYLFTGIPSGTYKVTFEPAGLGTGHRFTTQTAGSDTTVDSDGNVTTGITGDIVLDPDSGRIDLDQGIVVPLGSISLSKSIVDPETGDGNGDAATFPVTVTCIAPGGLASPAPFTVDLPRDGTPVVIGDLYVGSTCVVNENDTDGGTVTYTPSNTVTVGASGPTTVTVTNDYTAVSPPATVTPPTTITPPTTVTPPTPPTAPPAPPTTQPDGLPITGGNIAGMLTVAGALLAVGIATALVRRRHHLAG